MSDEMNALLQRARELIHRANVISEAGREARKRTTTIRARVQHAKTLTSSLHEPPDQGGASTDRLHDLPRELWDRLLSFLQPVGDGSLEIADWSGLMDVIAEQADAYPALLNIVAVNEARLIQHLKKTSDVQRESRRSVEEDPME
jgi:hypothetical protein